MAAMEASKLQLEPASPEPQSSDPEPEPEPEPAPQPTSAPGEPLMPGLGALLELATTPRERAPDTEADTDIGQWLTSIGAPESAEDIFLEREIDTLGELADAVATREDLGQLLPPELVEIGWETVLRVKPQRSS